MTRAALEPNGRERKATTLAVLQPGYLPWLGFFDLLARSDVFVLYDTVGFDKNGWRNRNRIKTANGVQWLTVPVITAGRLGQAILDTEIDNKTAWARKHIDSLRFAYAKAPHFRRYFDDLADVLSRGWSRLVDLDIALIDLMAGWLGLGGKTVLRSSELSLAEGRNDRLVALCEQFGANHYLSGDAAMCYVDEELFRQHGVTVEWQHYQHPTYSQLHGDFVSHLSAIDLIFNVGPQAGDMIVQSRPELQELGADRRRHGQAQ